MKKNGTVTYAGVIAKLAERLSAGLPPVIYDTRDFILIKDVVRAIAVSYYYKNTPRKI